MAGCPVASRQLRQQPPALRQLRRTLEAAVDVRARFFKTAQIQQNLAACEQRGRVIGITTLRLIQQPDRLTLQIEIAELRGTGQQQWYGQP